MNEALAASETDAFGTVNTGENRVSGVELEVVGMATDDLTVQGGLTRYASAEILKVHQSGECEPHAVELRQLLGEPAWRSTALPDELQVGVIGQYVSKRYGGQPDTRRLTVDRRLGL